jgi:putative ABC transport system substrate-binding protein
VLSHCLLLAQSGHPKTKVLRAATEPEIDGAFASMAQLTDAALIVAADPFLLAHSDYIVLLAARHSIPAISSVRNFAVAGGVMSYGTDFADSYRQAGIYTGRIVKGEKPADLPVQQSTKFEFVINLKTAKALGLTVPPSLLARADDSNRIGFGHANGYQYHAVAIRPQPKADPRFTKRLESIGIGRCAYIRRNRAAPAQVLFLR